MFYPSSIVDYRAKGEAQDAPSIEEVQMKLAERIAVVPWTATDPVGPEALSSLVRATATTPSFAEVEVP